jgi:hypothetical protein
MNSGLASGIGSSTLTGSPLARLLTTLALPLGVAIVMGCLVVYAEVNALILCLSLLASIFIMIDFRFGVICLIIIMPLSASSLLPRSMGGIGGLNPLNLLLLVTIVSCLLRGLPPGGLLRFVPKPLLWLYLLPIIVAAFLGSRHVAEIPALFVAEGMLEFNNTAGYFRDVLIKPLLFIVLFGLLVSAAARRSEHPEKLIYAMLVSIWGMGLMTIVFVFLSGASLSELASSRGREFFAPLGIHANDLGRLYAIAYALMLYTCAASNDLRFRLALVGTMGVIVLALLLTFSRSAFIGFLVVNALFLISRRKISIMIFGTLFLIVVALLLPGAVYDRLGTGWGAGLNAISAGRVDEIWTPLLPELWNNLIYGNGLSAILWSQAMRSGAILEVTHPHNAYLQLLLDTGIIGTILIGAYYVHVWKGFRRLIADPDLDPVMRGFYAGALTGLISFLVAGISGSSLMPCLEQIFLWLAIGMMYGQRDRKPGAASC